MGEQSATAGQIISLPQGGGAVRGIGEKFAPDLHTGTGNLTVPVATPQGRNGVQPSLALTYSTGAGNGPFGLGWGLGVPGVARTTAHGLPRFDDERDTFVLSGAEDLVPVERTPGVTRYRPRTEGLFARIEHHRGSTGDHWVVRSRDGLVSRYGTPRPADAPPGWADPATVADPADPDRIFAWHLTETSDPFGNRIVYDYRSDAGPGWTQTYLHRIRYVDVVDRGRTEFLVSVVLDYEDRPDVLSDRRATFEVRTRWRCRQIAVHSAAAGAEPVRTQRLRYDNGSANGASLLTAVLVEADDGARVESLPPLLFDYSRFEPDARQLIAVTGPELPARSLADPELELVDLDGNGLPDILETTGVVRFWRNLGDGRFDRPRRMRDAPTGVALGGPGTALLDADGDGRLDLLVDTGGLAGYYSLGADGQWDHRAFHRYETAPSFGLDDPEVRWIDLDGDGVIDALRTGSRFECFFNDRTAGWHEVRTIERGRHPDFPDVSFADPRVRLADMSGDGMADIVLVHDGRTEYWPSLGRGSFAGRRTMSGSPRFPEGYDPRRVLVGDVDGDGAADVVYVDDDEVTLWINQSGRGFAPPVRIKGTPAVTDLSALRLVDLLGTGVSGLLWSAPSGTTRSRTFFLDLTGGVKPGLLTSIDNRLGARTRIDYSTSTRSYLDDQREPGGRWTTSLPFPVLVVAAVTTTDEISGGTLTSTYRYHHGCWDGAEREFRGFGRVDQHDTEEFRPTTGAARERYSPPVETRTWFHQGPIGDEHGGWVEPDRAVEYWPADPPLLARPSELTAMLATLARRDRRDALRALRGQVLRTELYERDGGPRADRPVTVTESLVGLREESPPTGGDRQRIFFRHPLASRTTQWDRGTDPSTQLSFTGDHDAYGLARSQLSVAVPRGRDVRADAPGEPCLVSQAVTAYAHRDDAQLYLVGRAATSTSYEIVDPGARGVLATAAAAGAGQLERRLLGQTLTFYDGDAFEGLPLGRLGAHGVASRTETLVLTEQDLTAAHGTAAPPYLAPGGAVAWTPDYPVEFRERLAVRAGYAFRPGDASRARGFVAVSGRRYDVHGAPGTGRGLVLAERDALGAETTVDHDRHALLPTRVTDPNGLVTEAEYDYRTLAPRTVTDPNGNRTAFGYSPLGLLERIAVMGRPGEPVGDTLDVPGTRMSYDRHAFAERGRPASVRTVRRVHHVHDVEVPAAERDATIETVEHSDGFGRLLQTRTQAEDVVFDELGLPLDPAARPGDAVGRARAAGEPPRVVVSGWQTYDNKGRVVERYEPFSATGYAYAPPTDAQLGRKATIRYDARGRVIATIHPDGSEQRVVHGVPDDLADPDRFTPTPWEAYTYDGNDNAGRTHPGSATGYRGHWNTPTSVRLDALGRTVEAVARNGPDRGAWHRTRSTYDIRGNLLTLTDELGRLAFRHDHDRTGRVLRTEQLDAGTVRSVFDAGGRLVEQRHATGAIALHAYDTGHRPVRVWAGEDGQPPTLRQVLAYGTGAGAAAANLVGRLVRHHDEAGLTVVERCDARGNVCETVRRVISDEQLLSTDGRTRWGPPDWRPPAGTTLAELAATVLDPVEYRTTTAYDALGRPRHLRYPATVDGHRPELRPRFTSGGALEGVLLDGVPHVERIAYDAHGRRTLVVHGNGVLTRYAYDPDTFRLARLRTERFTRPAPLTYRPAGPPLQDLSYTYDLVGNLLTLLDRTPGSGVPATPDELLREFTYDPRYRLLSATGREHDLPGPSTPWTDVPGGADVTRTRGCTQRYSYDAAGNLTELRHQAGSGVATRAYALAPGTNRLASLTVGQTTFRYTHDEAGNMLSEGESRHLEWDAGNQLRAFRVQAGSAEPSVHARYLYDAAGMRTRKLVRKQGGQISSTVVIGGIFEHHRHVAGAVRRESNTLHVLDDRSRVALVRVGDPDPDDRTPAVQYQLGDHLGSAALTLDATGAEVSREEYHPYGETSFGGVATKRYRYTGKERDSESGLSYHGARYYAPWLARWTACDPAGPVDGSNLYRYARCSPMVLTDPSGTQSAPVEQRAATGTAQVAQGMAHAGVDILRGVTGLVDPDTYEGMASELGRRYDEAGGGALGVVHAGNMFNPFAQAFEAGVKMGEALGEGDVRGFTRYSIHAALSFVAAKALVQGPASVARSGAAAELEAAAPHIGSSTAATVGRSVTNPSGNRKLCVADVGAHEANFHRPPGAKAITNEDFVRASGRQVHSIENPIASIAEAEKFLNSGFAGLKAEGLITRNVRAELFSEPGRLWEHPGRYMVTIPEQGGAHAIHATVTEEIVIRHSVGGRIVSEAAAAELAADGAKVVARKIPKINFYDPQIGSELTPTSTVSWLKLTW